MNYENLFSGDFEQDYLGDLKMGNQEAENEHLVSTKLKMIRGKLQMSQTEFAKQIGVSRMAVGLWESSAKKPNGTKILPSQANVKKIAKLVNIDPFLITTPELGSDYFFDQLSEAKIDGCPLTDKEILEDFREWKEIVDRGGDPIEELMLSNIAFIKDEKIKKLQLDIAALEKGLEEAPNETMYEAALAKLKQKKLEEIALEKEKAAHLEAQAKIVGPEMINMLQDPDISTEEKLNSMELFFQNKKQQIDFNKNYNHSKKPPVGNYKSRLDTIYAKDYTLIKPKRNPYTKHQSFEEIKQKYPQKKGSWHEEGKAWLDDIADKHIPTEYRDRIKKEVDKIADSKKKPTATGRIEKSKTPVKLTYGKPQVASMEKQSNGFWPTVEHLMGYEKLSYGQCFNRTIFVGAYNKRQDFWVEDNNVVAKYCTLHSRNEMNLLRAEVERIVGELLLVEKMVGKSHRKCIFIYDREAKQDSGLLPALKPSDLPEWVTGLLAAAGISFWIFRNHMEAIEVMKQLVDAPKDKRKQVSSNYKPDWEAFKK